MATATNTELFSDITGIMIRMQNGDTAAFDELYKKTVKYVHYTVMGAGVPASDVDDVVQNTFIYIFNKYDTCKEPRAALSWIKKVAFSRSIDYLRKNSKDVLLSEEDGDYVFEDSALVAPIELPEDVVENKATRQLINDVLNKLPQKHLMIVKAFYFNDKKTREIAEEMGIPEGTVKATLARSRKTLEGEINSLARKHGIKLVAFAIVPVLGTVFSEEANACAIGAASMSGVYEAAVLGSKAGNMGVSTVLHTNVAAAPTAAPAPAPTTAPAPAPVSHIATGAAKKVGAGVGHSVKVKVASMVGVALVAAGGTVAAVNMVKEPEAQVPSTVVVAMAEDTSKTDEISDEAKRLEKLFAEQATMTESVEPSSVPQVVVPSVQPVPSSEPEEEEEEEEEETPTFVVQQQESKEAASKEEESKEALNISIAQLQYGHEYITETGEKFFLDENGKKYDYGTDYEYITHNGREALKIKKTGEVYYKSGDPVLVDDEEDKEPEPSSSQSP